MTLLRFDASIRNRRANSDNPISAISTRTNWSNFEFWFSSSSEREFKAIIADLMFRGYSWRQILALQVDAARLCACRRRILRLAGGTRRESVHVAAYIEQLQKARSTPTAKLRLAALRHLFD